MTALLPFCFQTDLVGAVLNDTKKQSAPVIIGGGLPFVSEDEHVAAHLNHLLNVGIVVSHVLYIYQESCHNRFILIFRVVSGCWVAWGGCGGNGEVVSRGYELRHSRGGVKLPN